MDCIERLGEDKIPLTICDTSTLSLSIDNQGTATVQVNILKKIGSNQNIEFTAAKFTFGTKIFRGFLDSVTPRRLEGTNFIEYVLVAVGMVCSAGEGGGVIGPPPLSGPNDVPAPSGSPVSSAVKSNRTRPGG